MNTLKHQKEQKSSNSLCKFEGRELVLYAPAGKNHAQDNQQVNAKNTDNFDISNIMSSQTHTNTGLEEATWLRGSSPRLQEVLVVS